MDDLPEHVTLHVGEATTLRLPSLAGAGYRWVATVDDGDVAEARASFDDAVTSASGRTSFSKHELLTIRGVRPGSTLIRCTQRRSWEQEASPLADHAIAVDVVAAASHGPKERGGSA